MVKEIPLNRGYVSLVDDEDYEKAMQFKWRVRVCRRADGNHRLYAVRTKWAPGQSKSGNVTEQLHRYLFPCELHVDHKDGNGLNNQKSNLRPATQSQNSANRKSKKQGTVSRYRGVLLDRKSGRWRAQLGFNIAAPAPDPVCANPECGHPQSCHYSYTEECDSVDGEDCYCKAFVPTAEPCVECGGYDGEHTGDCGAIN